MISLGELLDLIYSSRQRFRTVRAAGSSNGAAWRLWWAGDDHFRYEGEGSVQVQAGGNWWLVDRDGRAHTNAGDPKSHLSAPSALRILHTPSLLSEMVLEVTVEEIVVGRRAVAVRAEPRPGRSPGRWSWFWKESVPVELSIYLERGVALGGPGLSLEEIAFDEDFDAELFARPYPDEHPVIRPSDPPLEVEIEEALGAPFPVLFPRWLPDGARLVKCMMDRAQPPEWVAFSWAIDPGYLHHLDIRQGPAIGEDALRTYEEEFTDGRLKVKVAGRGPGRPQSNAILVGVDEVWAEIYSDLPMEDLMRIARSLEAAS